MLPSLQDAPRVPVPPGADFLRVTCPYCVGGYTEVLAIRQADAMQIEKIQDPRRCLTCGKYFKLRPRVILEGAQMED